MRPALLITLAVSGAAALVLGLYIHDTVAPGAEQPLPSDTLVHAQSAPGEQRLTVQTAAFGLPAPGDEPRPAPTAEQLAREMLDQSIIGKIQHFRDELQGFIGEAKLLPAQDHEPKARELLAEVDELLAAGYVTAPEALALRLSLLEYALPADEYRAAADTLVSEARQRAEQAEREWSTRSDPKLEYYRTEERRIVEQSAAMTEFPGGMTRQAYLRERLRELRVEIFSE